MIEIKNLSINFGKNEILKDINLEFKQGETVSILGANGCGKSSLLKCLLGIIKFRGEIFIDGIDTAKISTKNLAKLISYVPQNNKTSFDFIVLDIVLMGSYAKSGLFGYSKDSINNAKNVLNNMNLLHLANNKFNNLSGGQKQMVLIARAMLQDCKIMILDEPTSALDFGNSAKVLEILQNIKNKTIIQTTHNPQNTFFSDKVVILKDSRVFKYGDKNIINSQNLSDIYGIKIERF